MGTAHSMYPTPGHIPDGQDPCWSPDKEAGISPSCSLIVKQDKQSLPLFLSAFSFLGSNRTCFFYFLSFPASRFFPCIPCLVLPFLSLSFFLPSFQPLSIEPLHPAKQCEEVGEMLHILISSSQRGEMHRLGSQWRKQECRITFPK